MSNAWDIGCRTCNARSGLFEMNHGSDVLRSITVASAAVVAALEGARIVNATTYDCDSGLSKLIKVGEFFQAHTGHDVQPIDEQDCWDDRCNMIIHCPHCKAMKNCMEKKDHGHHKE